MDTRMIKRRLATLALLLLITYNGSAPVRGQSVSVEDAATVARLAAIEKAVEERRRALGIPGLSLVIVRDDKVIFKRGFGVRDRERALPVTPDTLFAIGSATKAFTSLTALMSAEEGRLSLEDSPKKHLPYFSLRDPVADAGVTLRDLLAHRTGLNRTDIAMATGALRREELIRVAGLARPAAGFREKFLYQNVMYTAAGEAVARANATTWERLVTDRIIKPLGMKSTVLTFAEMQKSSDYSFGYDHNPDTKETRRLRMLEDFAAAPAGAIISNAHDMGEWLRLLTGRGMYRDARLVSEKGFAELFTKQIGVAPGLDYGLGWFLREWRGQRVVDHGGNLEGFNAMVAFMPEKKLGFAMLSNVSYSPFGDEVSEIIWSNLLGAPQAQTPAPVAADATSTANDPKSEVGTYPVPGTGGAALEVVWKEGKLVLLAPGQPEIVLEPVGGRRYKFAEPAPEGFFVTFRQADEAAAETQMFLEQPHGNVTLKRARTDRAASPESPPKELTLAQKELAGSYENEKTGKPLEIAVEGERLLMLSQGFPPRALIEKEGDSFTLAGLPDNFRVTVRRDASGKPNGLLVRQPAGDASFRRTPDLKGAPPVEELMARVVTALGGEANLRRRRSMLMKTSIDFESEGIKGENTTSAKAPNKLASSTTLYALGKKIGDIFEYFDGAVGGVEASFGTPQVKAGKQLEDARIAADFYAPLNWKTLYQTVTLKRISRVGDEEVYVVAKTQENGNVVTDYISTKSFLVLRRESSVSYGGTTLKMTITEHFSDYRPVEGLMIPFKTVTNNPFEGTAVIVVNEVKFNIEVSEAMFRPARKKAGTGQTRRSRTRAL